MAQIRIMALRHSAFHSLLLIISCGFLRDQWPEPEYSLATYQTLGCWIPDPDISRAANENLLEVFLYSGVISWRHPYQSCILKPPDTA